MKKGKEREGGRLERNVEKNEIKVIGLKGIYSARGVSPLEDLQNIFLVKVGFWVAKMCVYFNIRINIL